MQLGKRKTIGGRKLTTFANILVVDKEDRRNRLTKWDTKPKSNNHVPSGTMCLPISIDQMVICYWFIEFLVAFVSAVITSQWIPFLRNDSLSFPLVKRTWNYWRTGIGRNRWDQRGRYDLPAVFDYVLSTTGREKLVYIGHSMGCIMFWVAMITHPELNDKIELMVRP